VRLLLGEIPERTVFMQKGMKAALAPYFELTNVSSTSVEKYNILLSSTVLTVSFYV
jgi:26S proteasome regulatory subunit N3